MRFPRYRFTVRAMMIAVAVVALCWAVIVRPLMRPYPFIQKVYTDPRNQWSVPWSDGTFTSYEHQEHPARATGPLGALVWVKWSDGSYSLHLRETRQPPKVEPPLGVPSVGDTPLF